MNRKMSAEQAAEEGTVVGENYTPAGRTGVFDVPAYDDIADLHELFKRFANTSVANGGDTMNGVYNVNGRLFVNGSEIKGSDHYIVVDKTASFSVTSGEVSQQTRYMVNTTTDVTLTIPDDLGVVVDGTKFTVVQAGKGRVLVVGSKAVGTLKTGGQFTTLEVMWHGGFWWCLSGGGGATPASAPSPPTITSCFGVSEGAYVGWLAPADDGGSPITQYLVEQSENGTTWIGAASTDGKTLESTISKLTTGKEYSFRAKAVNVKGVSDASNVLKATPSKVFNDATGGTETTYEKDGRFYRSHVFSAGGSLVVKKAVNPFNVLVCGGGGGSGNNAGSATNGGGGAGGLITKSLSLDEKSYPISVGLGGGPGGNGGGSSFGTLVTVSGGGTGGGNPNNDPGTTDPWPGGPGGSGGGSGGGNNTGKPDGGSGISGQGYSGGSGCYAGPGGGGGAGGPGQDGTDRYDPDGCSKGIGGPGVTTTLATGKPQIVAAGGRASVGSSWGGGAGGGCGGNQGGGQGGVVIVSYEVSSFNDATGGAVVEIDNYNGTGQKWRTHSFTSNADFVVTRSVEPFQFLVVAGGGGGGNRSIYYVSTGFGGAGGVLASTQAGMQGLSLSSGNYPVKVGAGGGGNGNGGNSSIQNVNAVGGGHGGEYGLAGQNGGSGGGGGYVVNPEGPLPGGSGIQGQGYNGVSGAGGAGGALQYASPISGVAKTYGGGNSGYGNGGASNNQEPNTGGSGTAGVVIIAYRIG